MKRAARFVLVLIAATLGAAFMLWLVATLDSGRRCPSTLPGASAYDAPHRCSR